MMEYTKEIFAEKNVNTGRQKELDIAKTVVIFILAFVHCTILCISDEELEIGIPYMLDTVLGGPLGAPMFMMAMGIGMAYTKKNTHRDFFKRGVRLFGAGLVLNVCRYTIPYIIGYMLTGECDKYIESLPYATLRNDIFQFAGLFMIGMAILKKMKIHDVIIVIIGILMSAMGNILNGIDFKSVPLNIFFGYFIGTEDMAGMIRSDFPLLNWFIVPASGYLFGSILLRVKDKKRFYRLISPSAVVIAVIYFLIGIYRNSGMFGYGQNCYYHISTGDVIICILAAIGSLGIYYAVSLKLPAVIQHIFNDISANMTLIYCIHWPLVTISVNVLLYYFAGTEKLSVGKTMLLAFVIEMVSIFTARLFRKMRKNK